jgi:hypothetical protein
VVDVLERTMYSEAEAARLLRVPPSTLHYWLEGGKRGARRYRPIIRPQPRNTRTVTWAEFVEAAWLREYRRERVPMVELRAFVDELRQKFGVPYPLADRRPLISGRRLVYEAQSTAKLDSEFYLVAVADEQLILTGPGASFVRWIDWDGDTLVGYRPDHDPASPVRVMPDMRFGRPSIKGVSTEAVWAPDSVWIPEVTPPRLADHQSGPADPASPSGDRGGPVLRGTHGRPQRYRGPQHVSAA